MRDPYRGRGSGSGVGGRGSGVGGRGSGVGGRGGRVGRYLPTYAHLHGRTDTQTCKRTINARTRRHKMYAKDIQNNIDITRIVSEIKSKYRGDARTRTPTNYNLSEQTEFVIRTGERVPRVLSGSTLTYRMSLENRNIRLCDN